MIVRKKNRGHVGDTAPREGLLLVNFPPSSWRGKKGKRTSSGGNLKRKGIPASEGKPLRGSRGLAFVWGKARLGLGDQGGGGAENGILFPLKEKRRVRMERERHAGVRIELNTTRGEEEKPPPA